MEVEIYGIGVDELENWIMDWFANQDYMEGLDSLSLDFFQGYITLGWTDRLQSEYFDWLLDDLEKEYRNIEIS